MTKNQIIEQIVLLRQRLDESSIGDDESSDCNIVFKHPDYLANFTSDKELVPLAEKRNFTNSNEICNFIRKEVGKQILYFDDLCNASSRLSHILNNSKDILLACDNNGLIVNCNGHAQYLFGFHSASEKKYVLDDLFANSGKLIDIHERVKSRGYFYEFEKVLNKDSKDFNLFFYWFGVIDKDDNNIGYIGVSFMSDFSDSFFNLISEGAVWDNAGDIYCSFYPDGSFDSFSNFFADNLNYSRKELEEISFLDLVHPNDLQKIIDILPSNSSNRIIDDFEVTLLRKSKSYIVLNGVFVFKYDYNSLSWIAHGRFKNVSELKLAQLAAQIADDRYKAVFNQNFLGIVITDLFGVVMEVNSKFTYIFDFKADTLKGKNLTDIIQQGSIKLGNTKKWLDKDNEKLTIELEVVLDSFKVLTCRESVELVKDQNGNASFFMYFYEDITEQKLVIKTNAIQSAKLNALLQSSSHLIFTVNRKKELSSYNEQFRRFFFMEMGVEPVLMTNLSEVLKKFYSSVDLKGYCYLHRLALQGKPQQVERYFNHKGGGVWLETYIDPIFGFNNEIDEVSFISHNITEKKTSEEKVKKTLLEKEILLKEIHHRVKNNLQLISSILSLQNAYLKDINVMNTLRDIQNRIRSMSLIHENLYMNSDISRVNLKNYVTELTQHLTQTLQPRNKGIVLNLVIEEVFLEIDTCIPCGLIINELVTNSFKHAFNRLKEGFINIEIRQVQSVVKFIVSDNGSGFMNSIDFRATKSLGLQLVIALVDQIGGTINLVSDSLGTGFLISFNNNNK